MTLFEKQMELSRRVFNKAWKTYDLATHLGAQGKQIIDLSSLVGNLARAIDNCGGDYLLYGDPTEWKRSSSILLDTRILTWRDNDDPYDQFTIRLIKRSGKEAEYFQVEDNIQNQGTIPKFKLQIHIRKTTEEPLRIGIIHTVDLYDHIRNHRRLQHVITCRKFVCHECDQVKWSMLDYPRNLFYISYTQDEYGDDVKWLNISFYHVESKLVFLWRDQPVLVG